MAVEHTLKCLPDYWKAIERGEKTFDVRRDDRGFQKGDTILLVRLRSDRPGIIEYPKQEIRRKIVYILTGGQLGIEPGYVVLGLKK